MSTHPAPERSAQEILAEWKAAESRRDREGDSARLTDEINVLRAELDDAVAREAAATTSAATEPVSDKDLRETSDALLRDLDVLAALEEEKRTLLPGDPGMVELATRVDELARRVLDLTSRQRDLTKLHEAGLDPTGEMGAPIELTPPRPISAILTDWRAEERRLAAATPGSADAVEAAARIDGLREEYRRAYEREAASSD